MSDHRTAVVTDEGKVLIVDTETGTYTEASREEPGLIGSVEEIGKEFLRQIFG